MNYPNGLKKRPLQKQNHVNVNQKYSNRGMRLEEDINLTNEFYLAESRAVIHKKPTPIQVVKVDYPVRSAAVIKEAYYKQASTTDYNGVYRGKYIDFEAKETKNKTRFPLANIHDHQIEHMERVIKQAGLSFMIIRFTVLDETYLLDAKDLLHFWSEQFKSGRKSISYEQIKAKGYLIPFKYQARVDYLSVVDQIYLTNID